MQVNYNSDDEYESVGKLHCLNESKPQVGLLEDPLRNENFFNKLKLDSNLAVNKHSDDSNPGEDECNKFSTCELNNVILNDQEQVQLYPDVQTVQSLVFLDAGADCYASGNRSGLS